MAKHSEIIAEIGIERMAEELSVSVRAVRLADERGYLPAMWFDACERLLGRPPPRSAFNFKGVKE